MATDLQKVNVAIIQNYINVSTFTILVYELFVLIQQEQKVVWRRRITAVSVLFFLNRYMTLFYGLLSFFTMFSLNPTSCTAVTRLEEAFAVFLFFVFAAFPAIRIYAIWQQNVALGALVFVLSAGPGAADTYLYSIVTPTVLAFPKPVCILNEPAARTIMKVVIASRTVSIFADALVLALTCIKTLSVSRGMRALQMQHSSISQLLVRKGFLYFLVFLLLNIIQTIIQETTGIEYLSPYIVAITSVLTSRFLLNLRQNNESSEAEPVISDIVFRRHSLNQFATTFVANFGEDLNFVEQIAPPV